MVTVIGPPERTTAAADWFLAGGISNCPDWQKDIIELLSHTSLTLANPRRAGRVDMVGTEGAEQIEWEYRHLEAARGVLFWFPEETLCPITLFELGAHSRRWPDVRLAVGTHPNYARRFDVETQLRLQGYSLPVLSSVEELAAAVLLQSQFC